jgi:hypothetical protein
MIAARGASYRESSAAITASTFTSVYRRCQGVPRERAWC